MHSCDVKNIIYICNVMKTIDRETANKSLAKMLADKESVRLYLKGKLTLASLTKQGVKLARPL